MIHAPVLDDIDFQALVEEARALIPRFAPDWTDHNFHDPGITLIDLIAWVADTQIYRVGFIGDRHLAAFAALLDVRAGLPAAAQGLVWPVRPPLPGALPAGAPALVTDAPDLHFRTSAAVPLTGVTVAAVRQLRGGEIVAAGRTGASALIIEGGDLLELELSGPLPDTGGPFSLGIATDREVAESARTAQAIRFESRTGTHGVWRRDAAADDGTAGLSRSGIILFEAAGATSLRLQVPSFLPVPVTVERIALDVLPVEQVRFEPAQVLAQATGLPDQQIQADLTGLLTPEDGGAALAIRTDDDTEWTEVADLSSSGPADRHFVRDGRAGAIRFGNGVNGRLPATGLRIVLQQLRRTLGARGNLARGQSWTVADTPYVNLRRLSGGRNADTVDDLVEALRLRAIRRDALVTGGDIAQAMASFRPLGIADHEVVTGVWPPLPKYPVCGTRTVIVRSDAGRLPPWLIDEVGRVAEQRRLLGERLFVVPPRPVPVAISARVAIGPGADRRDVQRRIEDLLTRRLSDRSPASGGWPAGRPVTPGEIVSIIATADEVEAVSDVLIMQAGASLASEPLTLGPADVAVLAAERLSLQIVRGAL